MTEQMRISDIEESPDAQKPVRLKPQWHRLVEENHEWAGGIARKIARKYTQRIPELERDFISIANVALVEAAQRFPGSATDNEGFRNFACLRIKGAIHDYQRKVGPLTRAEQRCSRAMTESPAMTEEEIAETLKVRIKTVQRAKAGRTYRTISLDNKSIKGLVNLENPEEQAIQSEEKAGRIAGVRRAMKKLPERNSRIILQYFEGTEDGLTMQQIGEAMGITESGVSQIIKRAKQKVRNQFLELERTR